MDSEEEVETRDEVLHATVVGARVWFLVTVLTGLVGARGVLQVREFYGSCHTT
jgi:hypothetical protein